MKSTDYVVRHFNISRHSTRYTGRLWFAFVGLNPSPMFGMGFPTLKAIKAAIRFFYDNRCSEQARNELWIFAVNPKNYSEVYGKLTPRRIKLRAEYLG